MDWVQQVQVPCDSYCGPNLLYGLPVKDNSVVWGFFYICFVLSSAFCSDDAVSSEERKWWRGEH